MKRLSRRALAVLVIAVVTSLAGLGVAVVAFGQTNSDPTSDYTVPLGDYTTTTPGTTPTTPVQQTSTVQHTGGKAPRGRRTIPSRSTGGSRVVTPVPHTTVRRVPSTLAFTGAEPLVIGFAGMALMLGGLTLHRRRRAARLRA